MLRLFNGLFVAFTVLIGTVQSVSAHAGEDHGGAIAPDMHPLWVLFELVVVLTTGFFVARWLASRGENPSAGS